MTTPTNETCLVGKKLDSDLLVISPPGEEVLRITPTGFVYKGKLIEDAGEAHRAFLEVMSLMKKS